MTEPRFPNAPGRTIPAATRRLVEARDGGKCVYCGDTEDLTIDHVYPWIQGGSHDPSNLVVACRTDNSILGDRVFREFKDRKQYVVDRRRMLSREQLQHIREVGFDDFSSLRR